LFLMDTLKEAFRGLNGVLETLGKDFQQAADLLSHYD
ncbi:unnamed protein product, partial [marine sediment metagenome]